MIEKAEDIETATFEEVVKWMNDHPYYNNEIEQKIWEKIIDVFSYYGYSLPKKWWDEPREADWWYD